MTNNSKITLRDIYDIVDRLETKMDKRMMEIKECVEIDSQRITSLEMFRTEIVAKGTVVVGIISLFFTVVWEYIKERILKQ